MSATELGSALRSWRERLAPAAVGLPVQSRRRANGLRREEVAQLAGLSGDYLVRLEQGRSRHPSAQVVRALARALQLDDVERDHLYRLAGHAPPTPRMDRRLTPSVQRVVDRLGDVPVSVIDAGWQTITQNRAADALFGGLAEATGRERNRAWRTFMEPADAGSLEEQTRSMVERDIVADLQAVSQRYPEDVEIAALVTDLREQSERFAELWDVTTPRDRGAQRKTVDHPTVGRMTLDCDVLAVRGSDLQIVVFTAEPGTPDDEALSMAVVAGLQPLDPETVAP